MDVVIDLLGHKAKLRGVTGQQKDGIWRKEDTLDIWFEFDKAVGSTLGFGIELPVKNYGKEEFLSAAKKEGEQRLTQILQKEVEGRERSKMKQKRQEELNSLASQIETMFSK